MRFQKASPRLGNSKEKEAMDKEIEANQDASIAIECLC